VYLDLAARSEPKGANFAVQELGAPARNPSARGVWAGLSPATGAMGTHRMHKVAVVMVCGLEWRAPLRRVVCLGNR
jgi:hypothetical protein